MSAKETCWFCRRTREEVYKDMPDWIHSEGYSGPDDKMLMINSRTQFSMNDEDRGPYVCVVCELTIPSMTLNLLETAENIYMYFEDQIRDILKDIVPSGFMFHLDMYRHQETETVDTSEKEIEK